jgi:hypothetical protein
MITKHNLKELIKTIEPSLIKEALDSNNDYLLIECHTFNVGSFATIEAVIYSPDTQDNAAANGNLFLDKDDFLRLADELEIFEY